MSNTEQQKAKIKAFLLQEFLPGEEPDELGDDTPLMTGGILDSISTVKLVAFLEKEFGVSFEAYEMNADYLDTLDGISATLQAKRA